MRKLNWSKNENRIIVSMVMTQFIMALFATLGSSLQQVLWLGFILMFLNVILWSVTDGRFRKKQP